MAQGMRIIAISDFVAAYAKKTYGIAASIIRTIPRGVDIDQFTPENVSAERLTILRKIWGITEDTRVILMPARITRWKGQSVLVQALAQLPYRNYICIIVGGGLESDYGRDLAREIKDAGLEGCVRCFTTCRDMPAAYSLADLVVAPSVRPEGFGRVVIEAQSMGAPIIATNHGGARETVIAGETGWLVEPNNASELARTIDTVLKLSPEQRRALAARCITHIRAHFTVAMMTSRTLEVYNELFTLNKCDISE